nr:MAG TPA: hypothetical protein [Caudoviricetes sp.]
MNFLIVPRTFQQPECCMLRVAPSYQPIVGKGFKNEPCRKIQFILQGFYRIESIRKVRLIGVQRVDQTLHVVTKYHRTHLATTTTMKNPVSSPTTAPASQSYEFLLFHLSIGSCSFHLFCSAIRYHVWRVTPSCFAASVTVRMCFSTCSCRMSKRLRSYSVGLRPSL